MHVKQTGHDARNSNYSNVDVSRSWCGIMSSRWNRPWDMTLTDAEFDEHYTGDFEVTNAISCIAACLLVRSCIYPCLLS